MALMYLPYDYARCSGTTDPVCDNCRRRGPVRPEYQSYIMQQPERAGECSMQIPLLVLNGSSNGAMSLDTTGH